MPRLRELLLELGGALDSGAARPFFQQLDAPQLQALELAGARGDRLVAALAAAAPRLPRLEALELDRAQFGAAGARALGAAAWQLTRLDVVARPRSEVWEEGLLDEAAALLLAAPPLRLRELRLEDLRLGEAGAGAVLAALASAPWLGGLRVLSFRRSGRLCGGGAHAVALRGVLAQAAALEALNMTACRLGPAAARALFAASLPALVALDLRDNQLELEQLGADAFRWMPALETLSLRGARVRAGDAALLARRPWTRLRELRLRDAALDDAALAALAAGEFPELSLLDVRGNGMVLELAAVRRWAPRLETLHYSDCVVDLTVDSD
jgi:hypothetical protein